MNARCDGLEAAPRWQYIVATRAFTTHHGIQDGEEDRGRTQIRCHLREKAADDNNEQDDNDPRNAREKLQ